MQLYKTKKLIENGVNFSAIYSNKQEQVKDLTGFDFNLSNIVSFLKKQTNDFTIQNSLAFDIDNQIYSIYMKWVDATDTKPTPSAEPKAPKGKTQPKEESETVKNYMLQVSDLKELIDIEDDEKLIAKYKSEVSDLEELIDIEKN
jgi:hypothetical protein